MAREKPHLNLVVVGHVDHGKSTLFGHLLYKLGVVDERTVNKFAEESEKTGIGDSFKFAWVLDNLKEERERGVTIDLAFQRFSTNKYDFTCIDAPGHRDFVKNMITGASQADCAILVVSGKKGEFESGISPGGQTREHSFLLFTLGVKQLVIAINKMDDQTCLWSEDRYNEIKTEVSDTLKRTGFPTQNISFIPISGWTGDNLKEKSSNMPWYKGPSIYEALDLFSEPSKPTDKPLRVPVQDVYTITGVGTVPVGRVETGTLKNGDRLVFLPSGAQGELKTIEMHHSMIEEAIPGDNIGFSVKGVSKKDVRRGEVVVRSDNLAPVVEEFIGQIFVIHHPTAIAAGYTPVIHVHTAQSAVTFTEILSKINPRTGEIIEQNPNFLKTGDAAQVKFSLIRPVVLENFKETPEFGRFAIRDMGSTVAAGIVKEITKTVEVKIKS